MVVRVGLATLAALLLMSCGNGDAVDESAVPVQTVTPELHPWDVFVEQQIEAHLEAHPAWAVMQGRHEYDGQLPDWSTYGLEKERKRLEQARAGAMGFDVASLSPLQQFQRDYFVSRIDHDLFWLVKARWPFRNPQFYIGWMNDSLDPSPYITLDYAPIEERMLAFVRYLESLPQAAIDIRNNLRMPMPETWLQLGVDSFGGYANYFRDDVPAVWASVDDPALQERFRIANDQAIVVMQGLAEWLESGRNIADDRYALGPELYREMLWDTERVDISLEELEAVGQADMARNLRNLRIACDEFAPGTDIPTCVGRMGARKPPGGAVETARVQVEETGKFLVEQNLVSIPGTETALVREAPPYARSNSAYISIPGPWEKNQPSIYYISPPNPAWPEEVQADYVPGESDLLFTSIHEVWPGHFLNFMHANRAPWVFGRAFVSYAYGEGWAHYTEEMMLDAGLRGGDAETRIGQLSNALLRNARFLASIGLHTKDWSVAEAKTFFMVEAHQAEGTAIQQAARGTYDPAYLNYMMGKLLIKSLREDWVAQRDGRQSWKAFHDRFLTFGGPPIPLVRQQMLGEDSARAVFPEIEVFEAAPAELLMTEEAAEEPRQLVWAWDCDDGQYLVTQQENLLLNLFIANDKFTLDPARSASGARYRTRNMEFWSKGEEALLTIEGKETACKVNRYHTLWADASLRGAEFRAVGNEPGWHLELFSDQPSIIVLDYGETTLNFQAGPAQPLASAAGEVYRGVSDAGDITITLTAGPCADTMADIDYESTVEIMVGDRRFRGCGNALR